MKPRQPGIEFIGPCVLHDQRCAVEPDHSAVLNMNRGVFEPSWKAQADSWHMVKADTALKRFVLRLFRLIEVD